MITFQSSIRLSVHHTSMWYPAEAGDMEHIPWNTLAVNFVYHLLSNLYEVRTFSHLTKRKTACIVLQNVKIHLQ